MTKLYLRAAGIILLILGVWSGIALNQASGRESTLEQQLEQLPDFDHLQQARDLFVRKRYAEARLLCDDIISAGLPGKEAAAELRLLCDKKQLPLSRRVWNSGKAFITGVPGSRLEESGAAVLSDMLMYGDIRDLALQGFYYLTGKEGDWFVLTLSAAGLATEMVDAVDWFPAVLKIMRKTAAISDSLASGILRLLARSSGMLRFTPEAKRSLGHLSDLFQKYGLIRSRNMLRNIHRTQDLDALAKVAAQHPRRVHLLAVSAGNRTPDLMRKLAAENVPDSFLVKLISKGPNGVTLVLRGTKSVRKGNADFLFQSSADELLKKYGTQAYWLPILLIAAGLALQIDLLWSVFRMLFKRFSAGRK